MSFVIASLATRAPTIRDRGAADHPDRDREPSRIWVLLEVLAYAGASIDPTAALAAQRFARIREQEQRHGRR